MLILTDVNKVKSTFFFFKSFCYISKDSLGLWKAEYKDNSYLKEVWKICLALSCSLIRSSVTGGINEWNDWSASVNGGLDVKLQLAISVLVWQLRYLKLFLHFWFWVFSSRFSINPGQL